MQRDVGYSARRWGGYGEGRARAGSREGSGPPCAVSYSLAKSCHPHQQRNHGGKQKPQRPRPGNTKHGQHREAPAAGPLPGIAAARRLPQPQGEADEPGVPGFPPGSLQPRLTPGCQARRPLPGCRSPRPVL